MVKSVVLVSWCNAFTTRLDRLGADQNLDDRLYSNTLWAGSSKFTPSPRFRIQKNGGVRGVFEKMHTAMEILDGKIR